MYKDSYVRATIRASIKHPSPLSLQLTGLGLWPLKTHFNGHGIIKTNYGHNVAVEEDNRSNCPLWKYIARKLSLCIILRDGDKSQLGDKLRIPGTQVSILFVFQRYVIFVWNPFRRNVTKNVYLTKKYFHFP